MDALPVEIVDLLLNGSASDGRPFLPPRWRFSAAMVSRAWRSCVRAPSPTDAQAIMDAGTPGAGLFDDLWVTGRLACVSALSDGLASGYLSLDGALMWLNGSGASVEVSCAALLASGCPRAIDYAMRDLAPRVDGTASSRQEWPWFLDDREKPAAGLAPPYEIGNYYPRQNPKPAPGTAYAGTWTDMVRVVCRAGRVDGLDAALSMCTSEERYKGFDRWADDAARGDHAALLVDLVRRAARPGFLPRATYGSLGDVVMDAWANAGGHAAMHSLAGLYALDPDLPYTWQMGKRWCWIEQAVNENAAGVLDWWEHTTGEAIHRRTALDFTGRALGNGAAASADWLAARLTPHDISGLAIRFGRFLRDRDVPARWVDGLAWLARHQPIEAVLNGAYNSSFERDRTHVTVPVIERWPVPGLDAFRTHINKTAHFALKGHRWRLLDRLVAAVDRAVAAGAEAPVFDVWALAVGVLSEAIAREGIGEGAQHIRKALVLVCAVAHRTRSLDGWDDCDALNVNERPVRPLGDVGSDAWARWCRVRPLDLGPRVLARFAHLATRHDSVMQDALVLLDLLAPLADNTPVGPVDS